jgi:hypothetical protein
MTSLSNRPLKSEKGKFDTFTLSAERPLYAQHRKYRCVALIDPLGQFGTHALKQRARANLPLLHYGNSASATAPYGPALQ